MTAVELCSVDAICGVVRRGAVAWFGLLRPTDTPATLDCGALVGEGNDTARWDALCEEYADIFAEPTGVPQRELTHAIDLVPGAEPPAKR